LRACRGHLKKGKFMYVSEPGNDRPLPANRMAFVNRLLALRVSVPEAAVYEDHFAVPWENKIWSAGQVPTMQAKSISESMHKRTDGNLRGSRPKSCSRSLTAPKSKGSGTTQCWRCCWAVALIAKWRRVSELFVVIAASVRTRGRGSVPSREAIDAKTWRVSI
jgi:hypothetical protein